MKNSYGMVCTNKNILGPYISVKITIWPISNTMPMFAHYVYVLIHSLLRKQRNPLYKIITGWF